MFSSWYPREDIPSWREIFTNFALTLKQSLSYESNSAYPRMHAHTHTHTHTKVSLSKKAMTNIKNNIDELQLTQFNLGKHFLFITYHLYLFPRNNNGYVLHIVIKCMSCCDVTAVVTHTCQQGLCLRSNIKATSSDRHGVSNYRSIKCLFNTLRTPTTETDQRSASLFFCEGNSSVTGGFLTQRDK